MPPWPSHICGNHLPAIVSAGLVPGCSFELSTSFDSPQLFPEHHNTRPAQSSESPTARLDARSANHRTAAIPPRGRRPKSDRRRWRSGRTGVGGQPVPDASTGRRRAPLHAVVEMHTVRAGLHDHVVAAARRAAHTVWCRDGRGLLDERPERVGRDRPGRTASQGVSCLEGRTRQILGQLCEAEPWATRKAAVWVAGRGAELRAVV